jgi:tetratricopeptide (TPR) repeat protein
MSISRPWSFIVTPPMTKPSHPRQRPPHVLRVAPPLTKNVGEQAFSGRAVLEEYTGAPGLLLWQSFRDAELWATANLKPGLFSQSAGERRELIRTLDDGEYRPIKAPLATLAQLATLDLAAAPDVASGCETIALWSQERGRLGTAVEYAQVASFAVPGNAIYAVRAARVLRVRAEYQRAWSWFEHAVYLARRSLDWQAYAEAYAGVGNLYIQVGNYPKARLAHTRCLRAARRNHLHDMVASAFHNLFILEMEVGSTEAAEKYAKKALDAYPLDSPSLPRLARDLAWRWMLLGYFDRALPLAQEALKHFSSPADQALVWSDIARAAAGVGQVDTFEDAWARTRVLMSEHVVDPWPADILVNLAHAAACLGEVARAQRAARQAVEIARVRREGTLLLAAEAILDSLSRAGAGEPRAGIQKVGSPDDRLVESFLRVLKEARAAA